MGIRDFIENMRYGGWKYHLRELQELNKTHALELRQHFHELQELLTVGVYEMELKGNSNYKTSVENNHEAAERVAKFEGLLDTAELRMRGQCEELEEQVHAHYNFIHSLTSGSLSVWLKMSENWSHIAQDGFIKKQCLSLHVLSAVPKLTLSSLKQIRKRALTLSAPQARTVESKYSKFMPLPMEIYSRIKAANENVDQAEVFACQVKERLVALEQVETQIVGVQHRLKESHELLSTYDTHLRTLLGRLNIRGNRGLTDEQLEFAAVANILVDALVTLSSDVILDPCDPSLDKQSNLRNDLRQLDQLIARFV